MSIHALIAKLTMTFQTARQSSAFLIYSGAVDLRICLILSKLDIAFRCFSSLENFLRRFPDGCEGSVLIDVNADLAGGIVRVEHLIAHLPQPCVIPLCAVGTLDFFRRCFKAGTVDVIDKSLDDQAIALALEAGVGRVGARCTLNSTRRLRFGLLTGRERLVFGYIANGHSNREIAQILSLSPRTIDCHRAHLNQKLGARNLAQMVYQYGAFLREHKIANITQGVQNVSQ
jgi:two-component system response regulator FixJ